MSVRIMVGDCRQRLTELAPDSFDSCVTDPPYELGFMGKRWDASGVTFDVTTWREVLRVLKPGAYLLAFGGTRTFHRMTCAIEDAGFEIKDCLSWLYGSGFPKHASKLKPAWEPIVVAWKPADRASPLNIDACRIAHLSEEDRVAAYPAGRLTSKPGALAGGTQREGERSEFSTYAGRGGTEFHLTPGPRGGDILGRWPANVVLDEDAAARLDAAAPETGAIAKVTGNRLATTGQSGIYNHFAPVEGVFHDDGLAGASRFFYCAKASRAERELGMEGAPRKMIRWSSGDESPGTFQSDGTDKTSSNYHPTVKPIALMEWLCRLVTPPNGTVLDPFFGSGSTALAAERAGYSVTAVELNPDYAAIAEQRCRGDNPLFANVTIA